MAENELKIAHPFEECDYKIEVADSNENYCRVVAEPLERGFGLTLGNALRRVLLASLPGTSVYAIEVRGAVHEFTALEGVEEDLTQIILNLKDLVLKSDTIGQADYEVTVDRGEGEFKAGDIELPTGLEVVNPNLVIAHVAQGGHLNMTLHIRNGRGYATSEENKTLGLNANTIATDSISDTLEDNSGQLNLSSQNGTVIVGENGITAIDRDNAKNRMQYTGKGIYASDNGGVTWSNIISAGKISIKNLEAGSIDANNISVTNIGHESSIVIDGKGITALNYTNGKIDPDFSNTPNNDKISFFLDAKNGYAFFRGNIEAGAGHIGGWTIRTGELYNNNVGMRSSDNGNEYAFWAGSSTPSNNSPFWVKHNGEMRATDATVTGTITATRGKIGNWTINNGSIYNGVTSLNSDGSFKAGNFTVDRNGNIVANGGTFNNISANGGNFNNVNVRGVITATSGTFDSCTVRNSCNLQCAVPGGLITSKSISANKLNVDTLSAITAEMGSLKAGSLQIGASGYLNFGGDFRITQHGNVYATSTNGSPIADGGTNAGVAIYRDKSVWVNGTSFPVGLVIRGNNHIGVTTSNVGDGDMHVGIDREVIVAESSMQGARQWRLEFLKGLLIGVHSY